MISLPSERGATETDKAGGENLFMAPKDKYVF